MDMTKYDKDITEIQVQKGELLKCPFGMLLSDITLIKGDLIDNNEPVNVGCIPCECCKYYVITRLTDYGRSILCGYLQRYQENLPDELFEI